MNQQNNPNDLNQNQNVILNLEHDADNDYTFRRRLLPNIIEIFDKHPGDYVNDYNRVKDDGHWELVFSKEYYNDIDITTKRIPELGIKGERFFFGNAIGKKDDDSQSRKYPVKLDFDQDEGMTTRYSTLPGREAGFIAVPPYIDTLERTEIPMLGGVKVDRHEGHVTEENYETLGYDEQWDIYKLSVYKQDEKRTYRFLNVNELGVGIAYLEGNRHDYYTSWTDWISVCHLIYEEKRGTTMRTKKCDASISSSTSSDPGTSSSTSSDPGTSSSTTSDAFPLGCFNKYSVTDYHEGDITGGTEYLKYKDDNLWYLHYDLFVRNNATLRITIFQKITIHDYHEGSITAENYTPDIGKSKDWSLYRRDYEEAQIEITFKLEKISKSKILSCTKEVINKMEETSKKYYLEMKTRREENSILQLKKGYSSYPVVTPPTYNVDDYQDECWKILEWTFTENGVKINVELIGKSVFSEVTIENENIILRYLVRKALNATDDDLIQDLYNNFKSMTHLKIYKEQQRLDNSSLFTQHTSSTTSTSSSTSSSFSDSLVVPRKPNYVYNLGTMKISRPKGIPFVLLDFGEFIRKDNRDQIIITQGYETKYYNQLNNAFKGSGSNFYLYKGNVEGKTMDNRNGYGSLYLCPERVDLNDAYFIIADPKGDINKHGIIKVCEGIWKDDKMRKGIVYVQEIRKDNVKTGTIGIDDGKIVSYNSPGDSYISLFQYEDLLQSIGIDMKPLKERENRIRTDIFKKMYQEQYQPNTSRDSVPQISSIPLQDNFLKIEVQNDSLFQTRFDTYKRKTDNHVRDMIRKEENPSEPYMYNSYRKIKENLEKEKQNQKIMKRDFSKIYQYHKLNPSNVIIFEKPPNLDTPLQGNYDNFAYGRHYRQFFQNENKKNIELDMKRIYNDSLKDFKYYIEIPDAAQGIYTNVAEFNKIHKEYFQTKKKEENMEKNRRNQKMNEIAITLYRLDNSQKKKGSGEQPAIQKFLSGDITNDMEISDMYTRLKNYGIDVSNDVKESIVQKYNKFVSQEKNRQNQVIHEIARTLWRKSIIILKEEEVFYDKKKVSVLFDEAYPYYKLKETKTKGGPNFVLKSIRVGEIFSVESVESNEIFFVKRSLTELEQKTESIKIIKKKSKAVELVDAECILLKITQLNPMERFELNLRNDHFIQDIYRQLEGEEINPGLPDVMDLVKKYYEIHEKEEFQKIFQQYQRIVNSNTDSIHIAIDAFMPIKEENLKISDEQVEIVRRINVILDNLNLQKQSDNFKSIKKKRVMGIRRGATRSMEGLHRDTNTLVSIIDKNLQKSYPNLYDTMNKPLNRHQNNQQNLPQNNQPNKILLNELDKRLIEANKKFKMDLHPDLKKKLLENPFRRLWEDNFQFNEIAILQVLRDLQKKEILKMIYEEIKFRLDHNYYKKTEFIEKYKDSITDIILQIPIAEDGRKYMYFIIDYANIKHRVEERLLQKIPQEIGKPKDFDALVKKEIDSDVEKFKNNNISPYREENKIELIPLVIVVQQGKDFFIDSNLQKTVITVPCKLGSIKKDAFSLRTDHDIEFQYNARMNFHKKNDTSRNMDMEGPITSSEAMMKKFTDNYNDYKSRIVKIQSKLGKLKSQKQQSDSSDQNKVTSSNPQQSIPGPDKSIEQLRNKRLKKIRANPNDDLMCIIIFCFLADYNHVNGVSDIDLCVRTMSHDGFTDYKRGSRDSGDFLKNYR